MRGGNDARNVLTAIIDPAASTLGLCLDALDIELDEHFVADDQAAAIERFTPDHAEVFPVQLAFGVEARPNIAPGILGNAVEVPR